MNLEKQHVVVIGGSSGIGLGVARASLEQGASVTLAGRSTQRLAEAVGQLGPSVAERVRTFVADAGDEEQVRRLFEAHPPAHHVVVTAVAAHYQPIRQLDLAAARRTLDSKLLAALHVAKHARFEAGGSLLLTGGVASSRPSPGGALIAAVNGAIDSLVLALALELAPVRVNALSPGWIDTPFWDAFAGSAKAQRLEQHARRLPVGRVGATTDTAQAALFLMTNGFTTGEVLHVDGGHRLV